jgi:hypothetical protein
MDEISTDDSGDREQTPRTRGESAIKFVGGFPCPKEQQHVIEKSERGCAFVQQVHDDSSEEEWVLNESDLNV